MYRQRVRVVKELVLKANGLCPREFKSRRCRIFVCFSFLSFLSFLSFCLFAFQSPIIHLSSTSYISDTVRVAQWIARLPPKEKVVGSTPTSDAFFLKLLFFGLCVVPWLRSTFRGSIVVSIPACHAGDPGSIPGSGVTFFLLVFLCYV